MVPREPEGRVLDTMVPAVEGVPRTLMLDEGVWTLSPAENAVEFACPVVAEMVLDLADSVVEL